MSQAHGTPAEPPTAQGARGATDPFPRPESRWADLGRRVHHVDHGGPADGPLLVCVHGLGGSLVNWAALAPLLTPTCRVLALDLAGFGLTQGSGDPTSVEANQQLLHRFLTEVAGPPAILVGNSMGGLIAAMQAARHPETVAGLVLVDPALPSGLRARPHPLVAFAFGLYAVPPLGRALLNGRRRARTPEQAAMDVLRLCCSDPGRVPAQVLRQHVELAHQRHSHTSADEEFLIAARSLLAALSRRRSLAAMLDAITAPVLLLHGDEDRLVPVAAARTTAAAHPAWRFEVAEGVGHVPQLEVPEWTAGHLLDWLDREGATARDAARHPTPG